MSERIRGCGEIYLKKGQKMPNKLFKNVIFFFLRFFLFLFFFFMKHFFLFFVFFFIKQWRKKGMIIFLQFKFLLAKKSKKI